MTCGGLTWFCIPLEALLRLNEIAVVVVLLSIAFAAAFASINGRRNRN